MISSRTKWVGRMNHVWSFFNADQHDFAFAAPTTNKANGRVIFERMQIGDDIHVYVDWIAVRASDPFPMCHVSLPNPASQNELFEFNDIDAMVTR